MFLPQLLTLGPPCVHSLASDVSPIGHLILLPNKQSGLLALAAEFCLSQVGRKTETSSGPLNSRWSAPWNVYSSRLRMKKSSSTTDFSPWSQWWGSKGTSPAIFYHVHSEFGKSTFSCPPRYSRETGNTVHSSYAGWCHHRYRRAGASRTKAVGLPERPKTSLSLQRSGSFSWHHWAHSEIFPIILPLHSRDRKPSCTSESLVSTTAHDQQFMSSKWETWLTL
jgi:hypothetical protein